MTVVIELPPDREAALQAQAQDRGLTIQQWLLQLAEQSGSSVTPADSQRSETRPIWEVITDRMKDVPDEVFDRLPKDGASQVDHYIYGLPKRD